jgi:flagellar protein FliS
MFASAVASSVSQRQAGAYKQMYAVTRVDGATPHGLIDMLYDGLIGAMTEARGAMRSRNVPAKSNAIRRAISIVNDGLIGGLNLEAGGALAQQLQGLYNYITVRLTHANLYNDEAAIAECGRLIERLRSAWAQIGAQVPS